MIFSSSSRALSPERALDPDAGCDLWASWASVHVITRAKGVLVGRSGEAGVVNAMTNCFHFGGSGKILERETENRFCS